LADSVRLTRYAFAMPTINARLGLLAALPVIPLCLSGQLAETNAVVVLVSDPSGAGISQAQIEGVLLETLLAKANSPVGKEFRKEALTNYLTASGADGYSVVLSLAEVDSTFHTGQLIVADERDGQPLGKYEPFQLTVPADSRPARWVRNLNSIRVHQAQ
jgi:hypothetical protein